MTMTLEELNSLPNPALEKLLQDGETPDFDELAGWEFCGVNSPSWAKLAGIKKFAKGFQLQDGDLYGYNLSAAGGSLDEPWQVKPNNESPKRFGFYRVSKVEPTSRDNLYLHALLLDYGRGKNPRLDPSRGLRDYLVRLEKDLYLGKAYYAVGSRRVFASYFFLRRWRKN